MCFDKLRNSNVRGLILMANCAEPLGPILLGPCNAESLTEATEKAFQIWTLGSHPPVDCCVSAGSIHLSGGYSVGAQRVSDDDDFSDPTIRAVDFVVFLCYSYDVSK